MPKSVLPKAAQNLGPKLAEAMRLRGVTQADVARAFGVKPPTVSKSWLRDGRIAKHHFPRLVEYFQLPYEWWFGQPAPTAGVYLIRRDKLRSVLKENYGGKRGRAAKEFGLSVADFAAYERGYAQIHADVARRIEKIADKPPGWLDVPPHREDRPRTLDERIAALPSALRSYLASELELCESVARRVDADFLAAPTPQNMRAFQDYLRSLEEGPRRKAG